MLIDLLEHTTEALRAADDAQADGHLVDSDRSGGVAVAVALADAHMQSALVDLRGALEVLQPYLPAIAHPRACGACRTTSRLVTSALLHLRGLGA